MAAVSQSEPLCQPCLYLTSFKVTVNIRKPLKPVHLSRKDVALEILSLCCQLDVLIRAEVSLEQLKQDISPVESETFHTRGKEIVERMKTSLGYLPEPIPELEDYFDAEGLSALFPRVEIFIIHGRPVDMLENPAMDEYFSYVSKLNQLVVLSQQLEDDVQHLGSHKYIAHQLSILYQVLKQFTWYLPFNILKRDIEANFKALKATLVKVDGCKQEPLLPSHFVSWILNLSHSIIQIVSSLPGELSEELMPAVSFCASL
ncbi:uncharacterized protein LOC122802714 isoform X2 [Protopterus annectens]|uniref:uncharacterized protein LOC122802714 isoform X2 n=1 Tax=Protopterus annectens TaxID=7888 RepID=UPI001CFBC92B|nr:uncharacterized protein LOC122802714 isoform X2 [Protopterus annectens]